MTSTEETSEEISTEETSWDVRIFRILMDPTGEEEEDTCPYRVGGPWDGDSDDDYSNPEERARDFHKYYQQLFSSNGFEVDEFPKINSLCGMTVPLNNVETDTNLQQLSEFAICTYNGEKGTNYKVVGIIKATCYCCAGFVYNITIKAEEDANDEDGNGKGVVFRASVYEDISGSIECSSCELHPKPQPQPNTSSSSSMADITGKECLAKDVKVEG